MRLVIDDLGIEFVRNHDKIVLFCDLRDIAQHRLGQRRTGRIRGIVQQYRLGLLRDGLADIVRIDLETVLVARRNRNRNAVNELDVRRIRYIARFDDDHLIARIDDSAKREVERLTHADGDDDLLVRRVAGRRLLIDLLSEQGPQFEQPPVRSIMRIAVLDRVDPLIGDLPRRDEIGLAHSERNAVRHRIDYIKKFPDCRRRDRLHRLRDI